MAALFLTCKELWNGDVRKEVVYLSLKDDNDVAMRFYRDDVFRIYVYSRVQNPSRQISISLNLSNCFGVTDVSALGKVHTLYLSRCSRVTDVSALGKVHTLDLYRCSGIINVRGQAQSALKNVHTLYLFSYDNYNSTTSW